VANQRLSNDPIKLDEEMGETGSGRRSRIISDNSDEERPVWRRRKVLLSQSSLEDLVEDMPATLLESTQLVSLSMCRCVYGEEPRVLPLQANRDWWSCQPAHSMALEGGNRHVMLVL
jgi:hypothetical protein